MTATSTNINHDDWTLSDAQGYVQQHRVEVRTYEDGTTRIGGTLHLSSDLAVSDDGRRIDSKVAGWSLTR